MMQRTIAKMYNLWKEKILTIKMPQLDNFYYLSQIFWLLFLFSIFHIYMKNYILPMVDEYFYVLKNLKNK